MKSTIESLFPLRGMLTSEILKDGDRGIRASCPGARTLLNALGEHRNLLHEAKGIMWYNRKGILTLKDGDKLIVTTVQHVAFMYQTKPMQVTFIIKQEL